MRVSGPLRPFRRLGDYVADEWLVVRRAERADGSPETRIHPPSLAFITLRAGGRRCSGGVSPSRKGEDALAASASRWW